MKKVKEKSKNGKMLNAIGITVVVLQLLLIFIPCAWGIMQTFKSRGNWIIDKLGFPEDPTFKSYDLFLDISF